MDKRFKSRKDLIFYFLKGSKRYFGLAVLFVCLLVLFELVEPKIIGYTVDLVIGDMSAMPDTVLDLIEKWGGRENLLGHLYYISALIIGIALLGAAFRYGFNLFNSMGAECLVKRMRDTLYEQITHLPYAWQDVNKTGDIIQRCTSDVDMIKRFLSEQLTGLFRTIVMIIMSMIFMIRINPWLALVAAVFIPVVVGYSVIFHGKIADSFEKVDTEEGRLSAIAQENLTGVRVVRAFGREQYERDRFETKNEAYTGLWVHMMKILAGFWVTNDVLTGVEVLAIQCIGAYLAVNDMLTAGNYIAFLTFNGLLVFPVRQLGRTISEMSKAGISIDRILYIMNSEREEDAKHAVNFPKTSDVSFGRVSFKYDLGEESSDKLVLDDISFEIKQGQTIGILGGTGSGKSTLVHLLDGLYDLPENCGTISVGGVDLKNIKKSELRSHIGIVLQEPFLFSGTLEENICIAKEDATHEEAVAAVATASLTETMEKFNDGYETYVGERGVTLSGGQKQRTAIAQMLIRKPDIMIFDDSLSAVDSQTDVKIRAGLKQASKESTVIMISHRISTLMQADCIFVLDGGKLAEAGTHEELVARNGIYKKIDDLQSGMMSYELIHKN